jgi:hypothetical protein
MRCGKMDLHARGEARRILSCAILMTIGVSCSFSQSIRADELTYGTFAGQLGERLTTLHVAKHYSSSVVDGFELDSVSKRITLVRGEQQSGGEWVLGEFPDSEHAFGTIRGRPNAQGFGGTYRARDGGATTPIQLNRVDDEIELAVIQEVDLKSEAFAEQAFQAAVAGDSREALHYLRLYRLTSQKHTAASDYWEELFEAKSSGASDAFYERARSLDPTRSDFAGIQDPLAYLLAERGDIADAKRIYRTQCRTHPYTQSTLAFTCLMYASLSEKTGDVTGMQDGYDYACEKLSFACHKAFGPAEERLIAAIAKSDSAAARKEIQQPGINVNAKHGKALEEAVLRQLKDVVKDLLAYGADPNANSNIMAYAVDGKDLEIPQLLLAHGANPPGKRYQEATCPMEPQLEVSPTSEHWLEGSSGQRQVRMYLERGGEAVIGAFYYVADWIPLILRGRWIGDGAIEMTATTGDNAETGRLKGSVSTAGFTGVWTPKDRPNQAVRLQPSPQRPCDGEGPWLLFDDARWPVTFSYPASWRVKAEADGVTLTCPDPSLMVYEDFNIRITQGTTTDGGTDLFVQCGTKWLYGNLCECGDLSSCSEAEVVHRGRMTILRGDEREWRIYCKGGGYIAQGYGDFGAVLLGQRWLGFIGDGPPSELVKGIIATVRPRP